MDIQILGDDDETERKDEIEQNLKDADDSGLDDNSQVGSIAEYIDDQIAQALVTGRMEAETRGEGNDDLVVKALMVNTALTLAVCGMMGYQWYF